MKNLLRIMSFITLLIFSTVYANEDSDSYKSFYLKSLTNFLASFSKNADQIWPGMEMNHTPLVIAYDDDSLYAFNFVPQNKQWKKEIINNMTVYHMEHDVLGVRQFKPTLTHPYFNLENKNALVFSPFTMSENYVWLNHYVLAGMYYAAHEVTTSAMAKERIENFTNAIIVHDGFTKAEELSLTFLEGAAFFEFSKTNNEEALKDFAAIAQYRDSHTNATTKTFENAYPPLPYLAYVGLKSVLEKENDIYTKLQSASPRFIASYFQERLFSGLKQDYLETLRYNQKVASFALDKVDGDWKKIATTTNLTPCQILEKHYTFNETELAARVANAKFLYNYNQILSIVSKKIDLAKMKIQESETAYQADKGVEITIQFPENDELQPFFKESGGEYPINSEKSVLNDILQLSNYFSGHLRIQLKNSAIVYLKSTDVDYNAHHQSITFKIPASMVIDIDGESDSAAHFAAIDRVIKCHELTAATDNTEDIHLELHTLQQKFMNVAVQKNHIFINLS